MAKQPNYLLGYGERLAEPIEIKGGGGEKFPPYTFEEAQNRLTAMLQATVQRLKDLPASACPDGRAVASLTLHPEYYAKSHHPGGFLHAIGLQAVGSRSRKITPEKRSRDRAPEEMITTELFVEGARSSFANFAASLQKLLPGAPASKLLPSIELIAAIEPSAKVKPLPVKDDQIPMEVVLHAGASQKDQFILRGFKAFTDELGLEPDMERLFFAGRLCFLRMYAAPSQADQIAQFTFLRVIREMPRLRTTRPVLRGKSPRPRAVELPAGDAIAPNLRVAVFDGGLPKSSPLLAWAAAYDVAGVGDSHPDLLWHGETVTSAVLFGSADGDKLDRPTCCVDHYRVLDTESENDPFELYDVLERINSVLDAKPYEFVSLSIGPTLPVDDEEVHAWTAVLDERLSDGRCLATIAVGNTGDEPEDPVLQSWRVQVPSDCVNGLAVGATDRRIGEWNRASYSSRGPGRSPGIVKPDLVAFGGSEHDPFWVCDSDHPGRVVVTAGTSYAAPLAMRAAANIRAYFGSVLSPLAIKALLIHGTDQGGHARDQVGWGRLPGSMDDLTICPDGSVRVVYQDEITAAKYRRIQIPMPSSGLQGSVHITATFCFATEIDPEHPGNYTRSGLSIFFRPNKGKFEDDGVHPKTDSFFQPAKLYTVEQELRKDAHKWETCLHMRKRKQATSLNGPVFDIHFNARSEGHADSAPRRIRYALVISIEAPKVKDLYDRVVRAYQTKLQPLNPILKVPIRP